MFDLLAAPGASPEGARLDRIRRSPNWDGKAFSNPVPTSLGVALGKTLVRQFTGKEERVPNGTLPVERSDASRYALVPSSGLRVTWLGHSSVLVEIDGYRVLIDPVLGERASPSQWFGPKRFHPAPMDVDALPAVDVVIITHDHYDHLDMAVMQAFARSKAQESAMFVTTLGVGAHLERWGIDRTCITELDWSESARIGDLTITACPARHFSGRLIKRNQTLWASWVLSAPSHRVFHSGDTGFFDALGEIGEKHGPFDLAMVKCGSYDELWPDIHLDPEEAVRVCRMVKGRVLLPIHWGTFNLAFHDWRDPIRRILPAAESAGIPVVAPVPGGWFEPSVPSVPSAPDPWWERV